MSRTSEVWCHNIWRVKRIPAIFLKSMKNTYFHKHLQSSNENPYSISYTRINSITWLFFLSVPKQFLKMFNIPIKSDEFLYIKFRLLGACNITSLCFLINARTSILEALGDQLQNRYRSLPPFYR